MKSIFDRLPDGLILLDGGMGQELINRKVSGQGALWSAKALFDNPAAVQAVHEDYIRAGADVITTNSYACIRNNFAPEGLLHRLGEMNRTGCRAGTAGAGQGWQKGADCGFNGPAKWQLPS